MTETQQNFSKFLLEFSDVRTTSAGAVSRKRVDQLAATMKTLLCIDSNKTNWYELFRGLQIGGEDILVEQARTSAFGYVIVLLFAAWTDLSLTSYSSELACIVDIKPQTEPLPGALFGISVRI